MSTMKITDTIQEYVLYISSCWRKNKTVLTTRLYLQLFYNFLQKEKQKQYTHELHIRDVIEYTAVLWSREFLWKKVDGRSLNNHISVIKLFLNYCDAMEYCKANTSIIHNFSFKRNKVQWISEKLYTRLFEEIKKQKRKEIVYRDLLLFWVGLFCWLRNSEARSIKFSDFEKGFMVIEWKSRDNRKVIFQPIMQDLAKKLKEEREKGYIQYNISLWRKKTYKVLDRSPDTVFTALNSNFFWLPLSIYWVNDIIDKYKRLLWVNQRITYHQFRHTYATNFANMGVPVKIVAQLMGHVHESTTMIYYDIVNFNKLSLYSEQYFKKYNNDILAL